MLEEIGNKKLVIDSIDLYNGPYNPPDGYGESIILSLMKVYCFYLNPNKKLRPEYIDAKVLTGGDQPV